MATLSVFIIVLAAVWFAVTNAHEVTVSFMIWEASLPVAFIVILSFAMGFLAGILKLAPGYLKSSYAARKQASALSTTEKERDTLAERASVLEGQMKELAPTAQGIDPLKAAPEEQAPKPPAAAT